MGLLAVMLLCGCTSAKTSYQTSYHTGFREEFKKSFLKSCERNSTDSRQKVYCTCSDTELEKRFDDNALTVLATHGASSEQRAEVQNIFKACRVQTLSAH